MHPRIVGRTPSRSGSAFHRNALQEQRPCRAFTLIELLVVMAIIAILVGLLFPAFKAVQNQAKQTQAKNDLTQIVNAVNAFYTEYGKYPTTGTNDLVYGCTTTNVAQPGPAPADFANNVLFNELRACTGATGSCGAAATLNTRQIVFISPPDVKAPTNPRSGMAINSTTINGIQVNLGDFVDPWGTPYNVRIDANYDNSVANSYGAQAVGGAGSDPIQAGVVAWSLGSDQALGNQISRGPPPVGDNVYRNPTTGAQSDDVISWQ
jgi:prepilin-type N-terminal cleavage/methylation domain-containing protein